MESSNKYYWLVFVFCIVSTAQSWLLIPPEPMFRSALSQALPLRLRQSHLFVPATLFQLGAQPTRQGSSSRRKNKKKRELEKRNQERKNKEQKRISNLNRKRNLHPAAKFKRILSSLDFWFSDGNLKQDDRLQYTLKSHYGYVPVSWFVECPKFQYWTDEELIVGALNTLEATKRYKLIYSKKLQDKVEADRKEQQKRVRLWEKRQKEVEKRQEEEEAKRFKLLKWAYKKRYRELRQKIQQEVAEERKLEGKLTDNEKIECYEFQEPWEVDERLEESDGFFQLQKEFLDLPEEVLVNCTDEVTDPKEGEEAMNVLTGLNIDKELIKTMEPTAETIDNMLALTRIVESNDDFDDSEMTIEDKEVECFQDSDWLQNISDPRYAFVRHKRVTMDYLAELQRETIDCSDDYNSTYGPDDFVGWLNDSGQGEAGIAIDADSGFDKSPKPVKKKHPNLPTYKSNREVVLIKKPSELKTFCGNLLSSTKKFVQLRDDEEKVSAIGFDVEYCSLELDIRNTLPAMIQIASPSPTGEVGLIWLDKFPGHGRDALVNPLYEPLLDIMSDSTILKVGVGVAGDIKNLAEWWNIKDSEHMSYFFSGFFDIEDEVTDSDIVGEHTLKELVASVLNRNLEKRKEKNKRRNKERRKSGRKVPTAHWRTETITPEMKSYAANDAASSIDIWVKLQSQGGASSISG